LTAIGIPLAALSKYSGLAAAAAAVALVLWRARHRLWPAVLALTPGVVAIAVFYLRNLYRLGTPLPLNSIIFHLQDWDPVRWGHPQGFFTRVDLKACSAPDSFSGGFWKWFFATDCFDLAPWRNTLSPALLVAALLVTALLLAAVLWVILRWPAEPFQILLVAIPAAVMLAFVVYVIRIPSATTDKGVYTLSTIVPLAVAGGLFLSRFLKRWQTTAVAYAALLGWSLVMANASGLG